MKKITFLLFLVLTICLSGYSQLNTGGTPFSFDHPNLIKSELIFETMPEVDIEQLFAEDAINDQYKDIPWRFGENLYVKLNPQNSGTWDALPKGDKVWRFGIKCPGAYTINLTFDNYNFRRGQNFLFTILRNHM